ncbi:hypothetical protein [Planctomyces sp. SH-PL62]|uniref:hypothetical protein n=1 Tax=Planctomyces sp. SH-PL62 TaxID=1636152 RepID=UPI00078E3A81|nr:hypothetical protein [Planctomyces sp. SH-PL62]AMV35835.1 hypothetical protein VT85_00225 [Planctomyces sp. SH-PL62]
MPPIIWFIHLLVLIVAMVFVAFLAVVLATFAVVALLVGFVLHKLGWDRRLVAYLLRKQGVRIAPVAKVRFDDLDEPIEARWTFDEPSLEDARRPG